MKKQAIRSSLVMVLVVSVIIGFLAGLVGELWVNSLLAPEIKFKNYQDLTKRLDQLISDKNSEIKNILTEQDYSFVETVESISPMTVKIYKYKNPGVQLSNNYLDTDVLGSGFILTNDGWVMTSKQVISDPKVNYLVQVGDNVYPVQDIVSDMMTDAVMIKLDANDLPVVDLGSKNSLFLGQSLLVYTLNEGLTKTSIASLNDVQFLKYNDLLQSSENFYHLIKLQGNFSEISIGAPVVNLDGRVVGVLLDTDGSLLPIDYLVGAMKTIVQRGVVERNYLGVHYLDLSTAPNFKSEQSSGAYLISDGVRPAIIPKSPAAKAGLLAGDIIVKVEAEEVNTLHSLTSLIQDYPVGSQIKLNVLRGDTELEIDVVLEKI